MVLNRRSDAEKEGVQGELIVNNVEHLAANVILEAMVDGVAVVNPNGTVIQANKAFLKMFGFKSLDEVRGVIFTEFLSERDIPRALEAFKKCLEIGVGINVEFAVKDASGREFPILLNGSVLKDKKGEFVGVVVVLRDITELKQLGKQREEANKKRMEELEKFAKITVGRELRMVELKKRIKELEEQLEKK